MYCKYCGNKIDLNTTQCASCGANINLNDGGQSFFDDNELDAWQSGSPSYSVQTSVPKTEMREPLPPQENEYPQPVPMPQVNSYASTSHSRARSKGKKNLLDYLNLSSSNKLIIFCIASALAIVLLVVAIIAVLHSETTGADTDVSPSASPTFAGDNNTNTATADDESSEVGDKTDKEATAGEDKTDKENADAEDGKKATAGDKEEVKDIKIMLDNREISHPVPAYIGQDGMLYISIDRVLKEMGYKSGVANSDNIMRVRYDHESTSQAIEIEKETDKIWVRENTESPDLQHLADKTFNQGSDTYVEAESFLKLIGYSKVSYDKAKAVLTVSK